MHLNLSTIAAVDQLGRVKIINLRCPAQALKLDVDVHLESSYRVPVILVIPQSKADVDCVASIY